MPISIAAYHAYRAATIARILAPGSLAPIVYEELDLKLEPPFVQRQADNELPVIVITDTTDNYTVATLQMDTSLLTLYTTHKSKEYSGTYKASYEYGDPGFPDNVRAQLHRHLREVIKRGMLGYVKPGYRESPYS